MSYKDVWLTTLQPLKNISDSKAQPKRVKTKKVEEIFANNIIQLLTPKETEVTQERLKVRQRIKELKKLPSTKENNLAIKELRKVLKELK